MAMLLRRACGRVAAVGGQRLSVVPRRTAWVARRAAVRARWVHGGRAATAAVTSDSDGDAAAADAVDEDDLAFATAQRSEMWLLRQLAADQGEDDFPANPYTSTAVYSDDIATDTTNPGDFSADDVGKYYTLPADLSTVFPDGVPGKLEESEFATTGAQRLMVRETALDLIQQLKAYAEGHAASKEGGEAPERLPGFRLLQGGRGIGKSAVMAQVVQYARTNGWVTLVVPSAWDVMNRGFVLTKSRTRPGMVDQHDIAMTMLKTVLDLHGEQLEQVPQRGTYPRDRYLPAEVDEIMITETRRMRAEHQDNVRKAKAVAAANNEDFVESSVPRESMDVLDKHVERAKYTVKDMVEWGLRHPPLATDALLALKAELQAATEFPVLVAVDGLNHFYDNSPYPVQGKLVPPEKLSIPSAFHFVTKNGFDHRQRVQSGIVIASTSLNRYHNLNTFNARAKVKGKMCITVPKLERDEINATLRNYAASGRFFLVNDAGLLDSNEIEYYRTLTDAVPERLYQCAMFH